MATKKIELGGLSIEDVEVDGKEVILVSGKGNMTMTAAKKGSLAFTSNGTTYIFEDHAVYNSGRTAVSLIGAADDYSATEKSTRKNVVTINASQVSSSIEITGNSKANVIIAGDEDSTLNGGKGNDTLIGGAGEDIFVYKKGEGNDLIRDYDEDDDQISISGALTDITDAAGGKNYSVVFTVGKSKLTVEDASDQEITFVSGKETKIFKDGVFYSGNSVTVPASFNEKGETTFDSNVTSIDASAAKKGVYLGGKSNAISIVGSGKNDTLSGYTGADTIEGGKGNDMLDGGAGADSLEGGDGNDTLDGGNDNDTLVGGKGNDSLVGDKGNDSLVGGDGNDTLKGGAGNDILEGDKGNDKIYGGSGDDKLWGGKGNDTLYGDGGDDTFIYTPGDGNDVIYGFEDGDTLTIDGDFNLANMKATVSKKGKELKLKIGAGSVTFKDIDATTFNINDSTYQLTEVTNSKGKVTGYAFNEITT